MPGMRRLTIVVAEASPQRFRTALTLAAAQAALGGRARLFLDGAAVALLSPTFQDEAAATYRAAGLPTLAELIDAAFDLGVEIVACQSGLVLAKLDAATLDQRLGYGGMVGLLQQLGDDRLTVV
jgi:predicted peroxiredoxin